MSIERLMAVQNLADRERKTQPNQPPEATEAGTTSMATETKNTNFPKKPEQTPTRPNIPTSNNNLTTANEPAKSHTAQNQPTLANIGSPSPQNQIQPAHKNPPIQKPEISRVDLSIAGTPHRIRCPSSEVANVNKTAEAINKSLKELRATVGKAPSNEELLVLHCLELYDQIRELNESCEQYKKQEQEANGMLDKLLKNAQAIL